MLALLFFFVAINGVLCQRLFGCFCCLCTTYLVFDFVHVFVHVFSFLFFLLLFRFFDVFVVDVPVCLFFAFAVVCVTVLVIVFCNIFLIRQLFFFFLFFFSFFLPNNSSVLRYFRFLFYSSSLVVVSFVS